MPIPTGLRALLSQMGLMQAAPGQGAATGTGAQASAMKGQKGAAPGQVIGQDGLLLTGLGYAPDDKRTDLKNVTERSNLTRFLRENLRDAPVLKKGALVPEEGLTRALAEAGDAAAPDGEAETAPPSEARDPRAEHDVRPQDRRDEPRLQGYKEAAEHAEARETAESSEPEQQHQRRQDERDDEDKPGAGWVAEENEEEGDERKPGLRAGDVLDERARCRGLLDDGSRCLRRSSAGTPYCREHAASVPQPRG